MPRTTDQKTLSSSASYTIGWITALSHERAAALMMLDERHGKPTDFVKNSSDPNSYTWGKVAGHNVVLASLPAGQYGLVSAAGTVHGLRASLPHIRVGLFVGIGAGVPGKHNILLGDVVVSTPDGTHGGVVQYDLYKSKHDGEHSNKERTGSLDLPPRAVLNALGNLRAEHEISDSRIPELLQVFQGNERTRVPYGYPGSGEDRLRSDTDPRDWPEVHYGTIASGNTLIKDTAERDALVLWLEGENVRPICFEMEAAGVMNGFPCLVIRGICDYADENKNDTWQRYAAATASAFAKEFLTYLDAVEVEETNSISEVLIDIKDSIAAMKSDFQDQRELSQLHTRLNVVTEASSRGHADEETVTCMRGTRIDLLEQINEWANHPKSKSIFWLCGQAGTGKSTIARSVVNMLDMPHRQIASFFFRRGEAGRHNAKKVFPTLAYQLASRISQMRHLVVKAFEIDPEISSKSLQRQCELLLERPLAGISQHAGIASGVIIAIDALDECDHSEVGTVLRLLARVAGLPSVPLRIFVTSRPDLPVELGFKRMDQTCHQDVRLEEAQEATIASDIRMYFQARFSDIKQISDLLRTYDRLPDDWPGEEILTDLVQMAHPLFIFASTVCRLLSDPAENPSRTLRMILDNRLEASQLDRTYKPVIETLLRKKTYQQGQWITSQFQKVIGPLVLLAEPLPVKALAQLLEVDQIYVFDITHCLQSVLLVPNDHARPIRTLHQSFRDYLTDPHHQQSSPFRVDPNHTHSQLALHCLHRLSKSGALKPDICSIVSPGIRRSGVDHQLVANHLPSDIAYAASYWPLHLRESKSALRDNDHVHQFLLHHFLHWLEALSWLGRLSWAVPYTTQLQSLVQTDEGTNLSAFLYDAHRFILNTQHVVSLAPLQLYYSALSFAPTESIVARTFYDTAVMIFQLLPQRPSAWGAEILRLEDEGSQFKDLNVGMIAFSPNGKRIATCTATGRIVVWDTSTGQQILVLEGDTETSQPERNYVAIAFSPKTDVRLALVRHDWRPYFPDRTQVLLRVCDLSTGEEVIQEVVDRDRRLMTAEFSHDHKWLILVWCQNYSNAVDDVVQMWDMTTRRPNLCKVWHSMARINRVAFTPNHHLLATSSTSWHILHDYPFATDSTNTRGAVLDDYSEFERISGSGSTEARSEALEIREFSTGRVLFRKSLGDITAMAFSANGRRLAVTRGNYLGFRNGRSWGRDGTLLIWEPARTQVSVDDTSADTTIDTHMLSIYKIVFHPDGKHLAVAGRVSGRAQDSLQIWNVASRRKSHEFDAPGCDRSSVLFSPDGRWLATGASSANHPARVWDLKIQKKPQAPATHETPVRELVFSSNGKHLASVSDDVLQIRDASTGRSTHIMSAKGGRTFVTAAFAPSEGELTILSTEDNIWTVQVTDTSTLKQIRKFSRQERLVALSHDAQSFATADFDRVHSKLIVVHIWNVPSLGRTHRFGVDECLSADELIWSADGKRIALVSMGVRMDFHRAHVLDLPSGEQDEVLRVRGDQKLCEVRFSDDGASLSACIQQDGYEQRLVGSIRFSTPAEPRAQTRSSALSCSGSWIRLHGRDTLWLPVEYRAVRLRNGTETALHQDKLAIAHEDGQISIFSI